MRNAHLKDAVAMCDFLAYIEEQIDLGAAGWDELQVARVINSFRLEQNESKGYSFDTIVGYGPHGAIPHYEPTNVTNIKIERDSTLVIDSGGQYSGECLCVRTCVCSCVCVYFHQTILLKF